MISANAIRIVPGNLGAGVSADRFLVDKLDETISVCDFGAKGDGTTDDTTAIQAAIATGHDLFFPPTANAYNITAELSPARVGQRFGGVGRRSKIKQLTTGSSVFVVASSYTDCEFRDLHVECADTAGGDTTGNGIRTVADRTSIVNCLFRGHRKAAVFLQDARDCSVLGNLFLDSLVLDTDIHSAAGYDIYVAYGSRGNLIQANRCLSGQGVGIGVQTITGTDDGSYNQILGNIIRNARMYGIMVYRNDQALPIEQTLYHTLVLGNTIDNVTGTVEHSTDGDVYGAGIYIQGAEFTLIQGNTVSRAHSANGATVNDQLTPGAIGVTNCAAVSIVGNIVRDSGKDGIHVSRGADLGLADALTRVEANEVYDWGRDGIRVLKRDNVVIDRNTCWNRTKTTGGAGIKVDDSGDGLYRRNVKIRGNDVRRAVASGIDVDFVRELVINDNYARGCGVHGIAVDRTIDFEIQRNRTHNNKTRNITTTANSSTGVARYNRSIGVSTGEAWPDGTGSSSTANAYVFSGTNVVSHDNEYDGTGAPSITTPAATAQDATPSVRGLKMLVTANASATTITALDDGVEGQTVEIHIGDANTTVDFTGTTLKGNGGADWTPASGDFMVCTKRGANWYCVVADAS